MQKSLEATGKTIDLAIQAGLTQLGLDRDDVSVEVLEQPRSGFFGIGASPAKVSLTYEVPDPEPAPEPAKAQAPKPEPRPSRPEPKPQQPAPREARPKPEPAAQPRAERQERQERPKPEKKPIVLPDPAPEGTMEAKIEAFMKGLLEHMGSEAVPSCTKVDDDTYAVELIGEHLGMLIGRRGDTLDAIQHITNYAINHSKSKRVRINVDAENYRKKREESLQRLAEKVAGKVVRSRRNITLEPMNAYERHVIHAALQDYPGVTTYSNGTEPGRRVVVAYSPYQSVPAGDDGDDE